MLPTGRNAPNSNFWQSMIRLTALIASARLRDQEQQRLLNDILLDSQSIKDLFLKLVTNTELYGMEGNDKLFREVEERLEGQLLVRSRQADSNASLLRSLTDNDIRSALTRAVVFIFFFLVLTTFPLTFLLARTKRGITTSLTELHKGTEFIGAGNLDFIIEEKKNDEIGELSRAFNQMTGNLKTVTASKVDLEREIVERKKVEDSLRESEERWATHPGEYRRCGHRHRRRRSDYVHEHRGRGVDRLDASRGFNKAGSRGLQHHQRAHPLPG